MRSHLLFSFFILYAGCSTKPPVIWENPYVSSPTQVTVQPTLNEISGMVQAGKDFNRFYLIEDSGNPTNLHVLNISGNIERSVHLANITNRDWEEISRMNGRIYIAETGDNNEQYATYYLYAFDESEVVKDTINAIDTYSFVYPDGSHDAEAMIADSISNTIYLITKRDERSRVYSLKAPFTNNMVAKFEGELSFTGATAAAITGSGGEVLVKNYGQVYWAFRLNAQPLIEALKSMKKIDYVLEPQGEALATGAEQEVQGFFTISELANSPSVKLYHYKRR